MLILTAHGGTHIALTLKVAQCNPIQTPTTTYNVNAMCRLYHYQFQYVIETVSLLKRVSRTTLDFAVKLTPQGHAHIEMTYGAMDKATWGRGSNSRICVEN